MSYYSFIPYDFLEFNPFFYCPCMDYVSFGDVYSSVPPWESIDFDHDFDHDFDFDFDFITDDIYHSCDWEGSSEFYPFDHDDIALDILRDMLRNLETEEIQNSHVLSSLASHPMLSDIWDSENEPSSTADGGYSLPPAFDHAEYEFINSMAAISLSTDGMSVATPGSANGRKRRNTL